MGNSVMQYRASIGAFHINNIELKIKVRQYLPTDLLVPFVILIMNGEKYLPLSILVFMFLDMQRYYDIIISNCLHCPQNLTDNIAKPCLTACHYILIQDIIITLNCMTYAMILAAVSLVKRLLLLLSGDIHTNPGPISSDLTENISIVHWNICSLRNKMDFVHIEATKHDIITISETCLNERDNSNNLAVPGFHPIVRRDRDGHGGVAIYVRSNMIMKERPDLDVPGLEVIWIETKINQNVLLVGSIYMPPNTPVAYWNLIKESINKAFNTPHRFILLGDLNTCFMHNPSPHLMEIIQQYSLNQLINDYTRIETVTRMGVTTITKSCIDLVLTSSMDLISNVSVLPKICSDHMLPCVKLNSKRIFSNYRKVTLNLTKLNVNRLMEELETINFLDICTNHSIDDSALLFSENIMQAVRTCTPTKIVKVRENSPLWLNEYILILREQKNYIHQTAKRLDTITMWECFRRFRNFYTDEVRNRKRNYLQELDNHISNEHNFNSKRWWKLVNNFLKNKGIESNDIPPLEIDDQTIYSNVKKANAFNVYFNSQSQITGNDDTLPNVDQDHQVMPRFQLNTEEVTVVLKNLDTSKAVGPDLVHNKILVAAYPIIAEPLTILFNRSLSEGIFPAVWKKAHITPIFKKGNRSSCSNYRPISLLSCVGKILEKCVKLHVVDFLNEHKIITIAQSGFTQGDSTIYQLLSIYDDFLKSLDNNIKTQAIFFDISKAFDRVWHKGLLHKLRVIGINDQLLTWFHSYLSDRKQAVVVNGSCSDFLTIPAGVPQGSVLGPLLFLIYINDINKGIVSTTKLFADDTSMYLSVDDDETRSETLNSDLNKINVWANKWKVTFNCQKTKLVNICRQNAIPTNQLVFEGTILEANFYHKHLGLVIQGNCKWNNHIDNVIAKTRMLVSCMKSYKYRLSRKSLEIMFKSYVLPHFDYADVIWDNCTQYQSEQLEQIQLEALRTIVGTVKGTSHEKLYNETGFIPLKERRKRHKLILFFKFINGMLPEHLSQRFPNLVSDTNIYHRRRPLERNLPKWKTELYRNSFFHDATYLWNALDDNMKTLTSIGAFKRNLSRNDIIIPPYFFIGDRKPHIFQCRLRLNMSDLNYDLVNRHLSEDNSCSCGHPREDATHFLLACPKFMNERKTTIDILPPLAKQVKHLLHGNLDFSIAFNSYIFLTVQDFIMLSGRFD